MFTQTSLVTSVGSGAGALRSGMAANQTGNLLGTDTLIITPNAIVNKSDHPGGVKKKRFGVVGNRATLFDYPDLAIKNPSGNGQSYKSQKGGYLPGNGMANGMGWQDPHHATFTEAADLTEAKEIAFRQSTATGHFVGPEHSMYHDKTEADIKERLIMMGEDYRRDYIRQLKAKGLTDEEIARKLSAEREKLVMNAEKMPYDKYRIMEAQLSQMLPTYEKEDYPNQSVAPGAVARRQDATSYERALNVGNPVANARKMAAARQEQRIRGEIKTVEPYVPEREQESIHSMITRISKEMDTRRDEKTQAALRTRQMTNKGRMDAQQKVIREKLLMAQHGSSQVANTPF